MEWKFFEVLTAGFLGKNEGKLYLGGEAGPTSGMPSSVTFRHGLSEPNCSSHQRVP
jgi:hypothetical protein